MRMTGEGWPKFLPEPKSSLTCRTLRPLRTRRLLDFFERSGRNLLAAEREAGVKHHVAYPSSARDRLEGNGYFLAKVAQERLIAASDFPTPFVRGHAILRVRSRRLPRLPSQATASLFPMPTSSRSPPPM